MDDRHGTVPDVSTPPGTGARPADHTLAAIACLRAARSAFANGNAERASLYYRIGLAHRTLAELLSQLDDGDGLRAPG